MDSFNVFMNTLDHFAEQAQIIVSETENAAFAHASALVDDIQSFRSELMRSFLEYVLSES